MQQFTIDIGLIIDEVARRHHIRLADDDPILASVTLTEHVHKVFAEHLKKLVQGVADQATDRLVAQIELGRREVASQAEGAKATASNLINDAGTWSAENLKRASLGASEDIKAAVSAALSTVRIDIQAARTSKRVAIWAAVISLLVSGAFLGGGVGFWLAGR
jgi:nitrous oxide reductase